MASRRGATGTGEGVAQGAVARAPRQVTLVVVESPAKARTLSRLLGPGFEVRATGGHLRDLPESRLGVDVERGFAPDWELVKGQSRALSDLKRAARRAGRVLLATDPDREGEAIAWHLSEALGAPGGDARVRRVLLYELTPEGVARALAAPEDLDRGRAEAQQARRILDRLVGFQASPLLWRAVRRGLSAGRVQSVALRLVVERERAREAHRPGERFRVEAALEGPGGLRLPARLVALDGRAAPSSREGAEAWAAALAGARFEVAGVERRPGEVAPPPPFTTATLQREASRRLGLAPRRTMALAQRLFEGVVLGEEGPVGLLTYVRTDSVRLAEEAEGALRAHAVAVHGAAAVPASPNRFPGRGRAQAAHEAIRPTTTAWPPERVRPLLTGAGSRDLARLYALVFERAVASQMAPAAVEELEVEIAAVAGPAGAPRRAVLRASGRALVAAGWWAAGDGPPEEPLWGPGPPGALRAGTPLALRDVRASGEAPAAPPRFDEAGLVEELDERGLGRPSTFAGIVDAIQERGYVEREGRALRPTPLGAAVCDVLAAALPRELDPAFTAAVEERLDRVEAGREGWREVLEWFHGPFRQALARAEAGAPAADEPVSCDRCGAPMAPKWGKHGRFLACTSWPRCRATRELGGAARPGAGEGEAAGQPCPACGGAMVLKRGRFGRFLACARYPACPGKSAVPTGVDCPKGCGGRLTERRSRHGRVFFGCSSWPACDAVIWDRPLPDPCPRCGHPYLVERRTPAGALVVACPSASCDQQAGPTPRRSS